MILWSVDLVGGFKMPLPSQCPKEFSCIPEHFLDDAMDLLVLTSRIPKALESFALVSGHCNFAMLHFLPDLNYMVAFYFCPNCLFFFGEQDDFLNFIIMFMSSSSYIKNPYLRAKMVEVLNCWTPQRRFILFLYSIINHF